MIERLRDPGFNAHRMFVADVKKAVREAYGGLPDPGNISPRIVGKQPLGFPVPPMMERVFGYGGNLRFVEFSFSSSTHQFGYSDGGDHLLSDRKLWLEFVKHPLVAGELGEQRYPTLHGKFELRAKRRECREFNGLAVPADGKCHCLVLDRSERQAYVFKWDEAVLFFPLTEPEEGDNHVVFKGKLVSRGCENGTVVASLEAVDEFRKWLNGARAVKPTVGSSKDKRRW